MRTSSLAFLILLTWRAALGQCQYSNTTSSLGIGLVEYDHYNHRTPVLEVFNDPELRDKVYSWNIYDESKPAPSCAKFHKPDYGIVHVVVLDSLAKSYQVLVNEKDVKYVPKTINYVFWSWKEYLSQSHGVRRDIENQNFKNQPIRKMPDDTSQLVELPNERLEFLCVIDFQGDWIRVKYDCFYNQKQNPNEGMPCSEYINDVRPQQRAG